MPKTVEFCFDVVSPTSYIAYKVLPKIVEHAGAEILWTPIFLGGVMQATGNRPPGTIENKGRWMRSDMARWAAHYGLEFQRNPHFPVNTLAVQRGAIAYADDPVFSSYLEAMFAAVWVEARDLAQPEELAQALGRVGIAPDVFMQRVSDETIKAKLKNNTEDAVARGVFGAPTFFVGETMHFGQDRLFMVAEDLGVDIRDALGTDATPVTIS